MIRQGHIGAWEYPWDMFEAAIDELMLSVKNHGGHN